MGTMRQGYIEQRRSCGNIVIFGAYSETETQIISNCAKLGFTVLGDHKKNTFFLLG